MKTLLINYEKSIQALERHAADAYGFGRNIALEVENQLLLKGNIDAEMVMNDLDRMADLYILSRKLYQMAGYLDKNHCNGEMLLYGEPLNHDE